jgi:LmbE family N-acetylglucosaminyl deacetylase
MGPKSDLDIGDILGVWAHPDDEAWLSAGLMMTAVAAGRRVVCLTATRGEAGFPDDDPRSFEERAAIRETEMAKSLSIMGVTEHRYLGFGDGHCAEVPDDEAVDTIAALIDEMRPSAVLTFGPDGGTGHFDHVAVCRWATQAVARAALPDVQLMYMTKRNAWVEEFFAGIDPSTVMMIEGMEIESVDEFELAVWYACEGDILERKLAAMRAQASQIEPFVEMVGVDRFRALLREEFFRAPRAGDAEILDRMTQLSRPAPPAIRG